MQSCSQCRRLVWVQTFTFSPWHSRQRSPSQGWSLDAVSRLIPAHWKQQPTARFYGKASDRHITTLDNEQAALPLRLTGDGVSYCHALTQLLLNFATRSHGESNTDTPIALTKSYRRRCLRLMGNSSSRRKGCTSWLR